MRDFIRTGVPFVDGCLGGLPDGQLSAILGGPRSGKTTLATALVVGALRRNESVVWVSAEEPTEALRQCAETFGYDARPALRARQLTLLGFGPHFDAKVASLDDPRPAMEELERTVRLRDARFVVVDPVDAVSPGRDAPRARRHARTAAEILRRERRTICVTLDVDHPAAAEWSSAAAAVLGCEVHDGAHTVVVRESSIEDLRGRSLPVELVDGAGLIAPWQRETTWQLDGARVEVAPAGRDDAPTPLRVAPGRDGSERSR